jgi:hypothetical protein
MDDIAQVSRREPCAASSSHQTAVAAQRARGCRPQIEEDLRKVEAILAASTGPRECASVRARANISLSFTVAARARDHALLPAAGPRAPPSKQDDAAQQGGGRQRAPGELPARSSLLRAAPSPAPQLPSKLLSLEERQKIIKGLLSERKARERQQQQQQQQLEQPATSQGLARPGSAAPESQQRVQQMLGERQLARASSGGWGVGGWVQQLPLRTGAPSSPPGPGSIARAPRPPARVQARTSC